MGSSSSKDAAGVSVTSSSSSGGRSLVGSRVFHSSCLGRRRRRRPSPNNNIADLLDQDHRNNKETDVPFPPQLEVEDDENENENDDEHEVNNDDLTNKCDPTTSSQQHLSSTPTPTPRSRSRFSFIPSNFSFARAASFGSSSSSSSSSLFSPPNTQHQHQHQHPPLPSFITSQAQAQTQAQAPPLSFHSSSSPNSLPISNAFPIHSHTSSALSPHQHNHHNTSAPRPTTQPVERSVRFSRTLSVGRLRDRVLRTSSFTDGFFARLQQHTQITTTLHPHVSPSPSPSTHQLPPLYNSIYNTQHDDLDTSRPREARYHDIMEHRTDFLERRRRIRSQVRALQRLGSRFENLSGHERSCILAGQHRSGHCTCRMSNRTRNPDDDTSARASISRIVMLAEALFEVLDEIHQQSVVLSSRTSVSSLGSIPAPKEVVESMPVKIYTKLQKHQLEEVAQCYICLVEYEEGDCVRILPCHHEFHKTCIDKWLKEIHRVCPLCRGDVCKSESLSSEN